MEENHPNLELEVGTLVKLQFGTDSTSKRHVTKIIGYVDPISIIVNTPQIDGKPILLREGQLTTARFLGANNVYAFLTSLRAVSLKPFPHLHLAYPSEIKSAMVRQAQRVRTDIQTTAVNISNESKCEVEAKVINISSNGALISAPDFLGEVGDKLRITIGVEFNSSRKQVAIVALIRNVRKGEQEEAGQCHHGVQFQASSITDHLLVQGLVYSQLSSM